jgi:hypothetical protein
LNVILAFLLSCGGTLRDQLRNVSNGAADLIDAGANSMLTRYCDDTMRAIGRTGTLSSDGHCRESGARMGSPATESELLELAVVRIRWQPVITQAEGVIHRHDLVRASLETAANVSDGQILAAIGSLSEAYEAMRQAAITAGVTPPPPLTIGGTP